jgi:hypothetical protein
MTRNIAPNAATGLDLPRPGPLLSTAQVRVFEVSDICGYVPIITAHSKAGLTRLYGMTACSSTSAAAGPGLATPQAPVIYDEFDAWDRASDEGFMGFERAL